MIWVAAGLIGTAVGLFVYLLISHKPEVSDLVLQERMQSDDSVAASAVGLADRLISNKGRESVSLRLSVAGSKLRPAEWAVLRSVAGLVLGAGALLLSGSFILGLLGVGAGLALASLWLRAKVNRVRRKFEDTLADTLQIIAGGLRSGLSFTAALHVVAADGQEPIKSEIQRVLAKEKLGGDMVDGLDGIAARMQSKAFQWVALAVRIQREVGGNLSEILATTTQTLRERAYLHRQVRTLSAEGRLSAYILIALPFAVTGVLVVTRPEYLRVLWTTPIGLTSVAVGLLMLTAGWFWMRAVVKVEV
jgi:tight adherence protein B